MKKGKFIFFLFFFYYFFQKKIKDLRSGREKLQNLGKNMGIMTLIGRYIWYPNQ
jgi:hypothetical protein